MMRQIYVAHERAPGGLCKIGMSREPHKRVRVIEDISGVDLTLTYASPMHPHSSVVENTAHKILRAQGKSKGRYFLEINSEWFNATPDEARAAVLKAIKIVDDNPPRKMVLREPTAEAKGDDANG